MKPEEVQKGLPVRHICNGQGFISSEIIKHDYGAVSERCLVTFTDGRKVPQHISNLEKYRPR